MSRTWGWTQSHQAIGEGHLALDRPLFRCFWHFNSFAHINFGVSVSLLGPSLEIHLPSGFFYIGWQDPLEQSPEDAEMTRREVAEIGRRRGIVAAALEWHDARQAFTSNKALPPDANSRFAIAEARLAAAVSK